MSGTAPGTIRHNGLYCVDKLRQKTAAGLLDKLPFGRTAGQFGKGIRGRVDIDDGAAVLKDGPRHLIGQIRGTGSADDDEKIGFGGGFKAAVKAKMAFIIGFVEP